ncbi:MAG TPA: glycoside hydrolase family 57 protein [Prolixibacteraceae bacterium]|nr:glycoside hydrolase family 57 protein [Prolixibacteraceae bacterium]HPS12613.1 glycoside hydrolase family 57 protein [Prolixibacteraceae bacterium]
MKTICLYFQLHQPFRFRRYRFFDIGNDHYYYDDYANETILRKVADQCYLPANKIILDAIKKHKGKFKVAFSLSGIALEQFQLYAPEVLQSFKDLAQTGCVEFLSETYSHSLVSLKSKEALEKQINQHDDLIEKLFGQRPTVFRNTELIYSDDIGNIVYNMGFKAILAEGAKHVLGWKSPGYLYTNAMNPRLKVLMRNYKLSDDISFRFSNREWSEFPLTTEKFTSWIMNMTPQEEVINLFMDYETFGEHQQASSGIMDFLKELPNTVLKNKTLQFDTPANITENLQPVSNVHVPYPISWADEERDLSAWLGNEMQKEAFDKLYSLLPRIEKCHDDEMLKDWAYLQISDHFYYMCTKFFSDGEVHKYFNPYDSPYEAFINYMNVLSDFTLRLDKLVPENEREAQLASYQKLIDEKEEQIRKLEAELKKKSVTKKMDTPKESVKKGVITKKK